MQTPIQQLISLGPLPSSAAATVPVIQRYETLLASVQKPVSDEEAAALVTLFGPDDCFGLGWTLLHLIETAPGWPIKAVLDGSQGEWIDRLRERST